MNGSRHLYRTAARLRARSWLPWVALGAMLAWQAPSQFRNVRISNSGSPQETAIVVNPAQPQHMLAGANINRYFYSTNGGANWTGGTLSSPYGVNGDPCVVVDTNGSYYFFHLANPPGDPWIDRIVCQRTDALGSPWSPGTYTGLNGSKAQDKEWAVVDRIRHRLHVSWTQFDVYGSSDPTNRSVILFSSSGDGGQTWSAPVRLNEVDGDCLDGDNTVEGAVPAVGPAGEVYVAWAGPAGIVMNRSLDGGVHWQATNQFVSDQPGGWDFAIPSVHRCNGLPVTCCDTSAGPHRGALYVSWTDQRNGTDDTDVWLCRSTDGGATWAPRKRVNNDPPGRHQFFSWMTVDASDGAIYVVFYDRRNFSDAQTEVFLAVSRDGGENFVNLRVSDTPFTPQKSVFMGDYTGISAHGGVVRPVWARLDGTALSMWTALVNPSPAFSAVAVDGGMVRLTLTNVFPYMTNFIERSVDPGSPVSWTDAGFVTGVEGSAEWSEPIASGRAFYRVRAY